jgi:DNA-binding NarL/FixJ family response regulator
VVVREVMVAAPVDFVRDQGRLESLGITPRELEILELIAAGLSNKEIAERVHVSENTVKTYSSRVFDKLGARAVASRSPVYARDGRGAEPEAAGSGRVIGGQYVDLDE